MNRFRPRGVWGFILRRLLLGVLVLILVSILVFLATQALPGDPARAILGRQANPASLAALRRQLHLDRPVIDQYWTWVTGLLHGNLGISLAAQEPVTTLLRPRLVNSGVLMAGRTWNTVVANRMTSTRATTNSGSAAMASSTFELV